MTGMRIATRIGMSRDHRKLRFFAIADQLVVDVYKLSFPNSERFGLESQIRRAAISVVTNVVEGAARTSDDAYKHFLEISLGSACEVRYLVDLAARLSILSPQDATSICDRYTDVIKATQGLITTIKRADR
jgi:four helix bundle protein